MMVDLTSHYCRLRSEGTWYYRTGILSGSGSRLWKRIRDLEELAEAIKKNVHDLIPKHITKEDIFASINYNMHLEYGIGNDDDIDHLGNRRIRAVGELLQNQYQYRSFQTGESGS